MNYEQFAFWMQGFFETANPTAINKEQTKIIKDHLNLVFTKVTPDYNKYTPLTITTCGTGGSATTSQATSYPNGTTISNGETSLKYCGNAQNLFP